MRLYVATTLGNIEQGKRLRDALKGEGHEITYDWMEHLDLREHESYEAMREKAQFESDGVSAADAVVLLLPGGMGAHVELGMALASGVPVIVAAQGDILHWEPYPSVFWWHPGVRYRIQAEQENDLFDCIIDTLEDL